MEVNYQGSKEHKENMLAARKKGILQAEVNKQKRIEEYNKSPKQCLYCSKPIDYNLKNRNKFCNRSCAASYNNLKRAPKSKESKKRTSETLKVKFKSGELKAPKFYGNTFGSKKKKRIQNLYP